MLSGQHHFDCWFDVVFIDLEATEGQSSAAAANGCSNPILYQWALRLSNWTSVQTGMSIDEGTDTGLAILKGEDILASLSDDE
jgi:hypothetical protein